MGDIILNGIKYVGGGGSGGHTIIDPLGQDMPQRTGLQFIGASVTDDSANNKTVVNITGGSTIYEYMPTCFDTQEREVGCWKDGKPLYQKTFEFGSALTLNANTWTNTAISNSDIETVADVIGFNNSGSVFRFIGANRDTGSYIQLIQTRNSALALNGVTLQYTKVSDTAGAGVWTPSGVPSVHYSTSEQVIGTWIDGKPLYQKTISCGALPNNTTKNVGHSIADIEYAVIIQGSARNPNNGIQIPLPYVYGNTRCLQTYIDSTNIKLISTENMSGYTESYVTIQYTKTTD